MSKVQKITLCVAVLVIVALLVVCGVTNGAAKEVPCIDCHNTGLVDGDAATASRGCIVGGIGYVGSLFPDVHPFVSVPRRIHLIRPNIGLCININVRNINVGAVIQCHVPGGQEG